MRTCNTIKDLQNPATSVYTLNFHKCHSRNLILDFDRVRERTNLILHDCFHLSISHLDPPTNIETIICNYASRIFNYSHVITRILLEDIYPSQGISI